MKVLEELARNNWDFILFKTDEGLVMNVVFHSSASDYTRSFRMNSEIKLELESLKKISEEIRSNYDSYKEIEVSPALKNKRK